MLHGQGASMALPIWTKYMNKVYADKKDNGEVYEEVDEPTPDMGLDDLFN